MHGDIHCTAPAMHPEQTMPVSLQPPPSPVPTLLQPSLHGPCKPPGSHALLVSRTLNPLCHQLPAGVFPVALQTRAHASQAFATLPASRFPAGTLPEHSLLASATSTPEGHLLLTWRP